MPYITCGSVLLPEEIVHICKTLLLDHQELPRSRHVWQDLLRLLFSLLGMLKKIQSTVLLGQDIVFEPL